MCHIISLDETCIIFTCNDIHKYAASHLFEFINALQDTNGHIWSLSVSRNINVYVLNCMFYTTVVGINITEHHLNNKKIVCCFYADYLVRMFIWNL